MPFIDTFIRQVFRFRKPVTVTLIVITAFALWQTSNLTVSNDLEIWFVDNDPALLEYRAFQNEFGNDELIAVAVRSAQGFESAAGTAQLKSATQAVAAVAGVAKARSLATVSGLLPLEQLLSNDGRTALIVVTLDALQDIDARRGEIFAAIDDALSERGFTVKKAGVGVIYEALNDAAQTDAGLLLGVSSLLIAGLLWYSYRSLRSVVLLFTAIACAAIWMLSLFTLTGRQINMVTMMLPSLVMIIGLASGVHLWFAMTQEADPQVSKLQRIAFVARPCLINALTTAAGFGALYLSDLMIIRDLGLFAAIGVALAAVLTVIICTVASESVSDNTAVPTWLNQIPAVTARLATDRPRLVLCLALCAALVSAVGISRLEIDTYSIDYLAADHPVRQDSTFIEKELGAYTPVEFLVRTPDRDILRPDVMMAVTDWQNEAEALPGIGWSNQAFGEDSSRVTFGVGMQSARSMQQTIQRLSAAADLPADAEIVVTGYMPLYARIIDYLVISQSQSLGLALLVVFGVISLAFRSLKCTLLAIPVNIFPVLIVLGLMGFTGIRVDVATVTIAAIILGLMVDDTVHILHRLRHESTNDNIVSAIRRTHASTGVALTITTMIIVVGFSVFVLASIKSVAWFGILIACAALAALAADLLLLPALLMITSGQTRQFKIAAGPVAKGGFSVK